MFVTALTSAVIVLVSWYDSNLIISNGLRGFEIGTALFFEMIVTLVSIVIPLATVDTFIFKADSNLKDKESYHVNKFRIFTNVLLIHVFMLIGKISMWVREIYVYKENVYVPDKYHMLFSIIALILGVISYHGILFRGIRWFFEALWLRVVYSLIKIVWTCIVWMFEKLWLGIIWILIKIIWSYIVCLVKVTWMEILKLLRLIPVFIKQILKLRPKFLKK